MNAEQLIFEREIRAPVQQVYRAFTNSTAIREWLCDAATTDPHPGGRMYLWWNGGYYTSGEFIKLTKDQEIVFTWLGRTDPAKTRVEVLLSQKGEITHLKLQHSGLGTDEAWSAAGVNFKKGWETHLENLVHTLEVGPDLRIITRPMMGIGPDDFDETVAQELGVPVTRGIRISTVIDGMGAQAAGVQKDDVVIDISGHAVTDYPSLTDAMQGRKAGEEILMTVYRGAQKMTFPMKLSPRPIPQVPPTAAGLAAAVQPHYAQMQADIETFLLDVNEEEAGRKPKEGEWSIKDVLVHLIHSERGWQNAMGEIITSSEPSYDDFGGNADARIEATLAAYPSLKELISELNHCYIETLAILANLPSDFVARKASYWRLGYQVMQFNFHFQVHLDQMQATLKSIRQQPA